MNRCMLPILYLVAVAADGWSHDWGTTSDMTFADFNSNEILTDAQLAFVSSKYRIISLEKCTGIRSGVMTEDAIYATAQRLKKADPKTKVIFYLATDQQGLNCYAANATFAAHPEWWLKDDKGTPIVRTRSYQLDPTNAEARAWWTSIPMKGDGNGTYKGQPVSELIDGVLADSGGWSKYPGVSVARLEAVEDAKFKMIGDLQKIMTEANGGVVMANGLSMYGGPNEDPRSPGDHNLKVLEHANAIMNEHTAVFESVNTQNASFNMDTVSQDLEAIITASKAHNGSKTVFVQTWPGLYVSTSFYPTKSGPASVYPKGGEPTPQNMDEWRDVLRKHFTFAHALFLSIAEANMYWMYAGFWYSSNTGYIACPEDLKSCPAPEEWYPNLDKPLGAPLGDRVLVRPYVWTREFEHATVHLDLFMPNASTVTFKTAGLLA